MTKTVELSRNVRFIIDQFMAINRSLVVLASNDSPDPFTIPKQVKVNAANVICPKYKTLLLLSTMLVDFIHGNGRMAQL